MLNDLTRRLGSADAVVAAVLEGDVEFFAFCAGWAGLGAIAPASLDELEARALAAGQPRLYESIARSLQTADGQRNDAATDYAPRAMTRFLAGTDMSPAAWRDALRAAMTA